MFNENQEPFLKSTLQYKCTVYCSDETGFLLQVKSTVDQEREDFMRHKEMFRTDQDPARKIVHQKRKYSVSKVRSLIGQD